MTKVAEAMRLRVNLDALERLLSEYGRRMKEARELRRRSADWEYIERQPEPLRTALKLLVETGDVKYVSQVTGIAPERLECARKEAGIPRVVL